MEETDSQETDREMIAEAFDESEDPLADHEATFTALAVDPFELFLTDVLDERNPADDTRTAYSRLIQQWRDHMAQNGRHPACPNESHVRAFVEDALTIRENKPKTVRSKLNRLNYIYEFWQHDPVFPHTAEYNPFSLVLAKRDLSGDSKRKELPRLSFEDLSKIIKSVTHIRDKAILVIQLKLGLRASEVSNMQLQDVNIADSILQSTYSVLGSHDELKGRPNAVYIPASDERDQNKSRRSRVLPLDEELQALFRRYLYVRPDAEHDWIFYSKGTQRKLNRESVNTAWTDVFHPEYAETDEYRAITSHYGRHRFTTYWLVEQDVNRELVRYMRGDVVNFDDIGYEAIDSYIHTYYEDIEERYRQGIFTLNAVQWSIDQAL